MSQHHIELCNPEATVNRNMSLLSGISDAKDNGYNGSGSSVSLQNAPNIAREVEARKVVRYAIDAQHCQADVSAAMSEASALVPKQQKELQQSSKATTAKKLWQQKRHLQLQLRTPLFPKQQKDMDCDNDSEHSSLKMAPTVGTKSSNEENSIDDPILPFSSSPTVAIGTPEGANISGTAPTPKITNHSTATDIKMTLKLLDSRASSSQCGSFVVRNGDMKVRSSPESQDLEATSRQETRRGVITVNSTYTDNALSTQLSSDNTDMGIHENIPSNCSSTSRALETTSCFKNRSTPIVNLLPLPSADVDSFILNRSKLSTSDIAFRPSTNESTRSDAPPKSAGETTACSNSSTKQSREDNINSHDQSNSQGSPSTLRNGSSWDSLSSEEKKSCSAAIVPAGPRIAASTSDSNGIDSAANKRVSTTTRSYYGSHTSGSLSRSETSASTELSSRRSIIDGCFKSVSDISGSTDHSSGSKSNAVINAVSSSDLAIANHSPIRSASAIEYLCPEIERESTGSTSSNVQSVPFSTTGRDCADIVSSPDHHCDSNLPVNSDSTLLQSSGDAECGSGVASKVESVTLDSYEDLDVSPELLDTIKLYIDLVTSTGTLHMGSDRAESLLEAVDNEILQNLSSRKGALEMGSVRPASVFEAGDNEILQSISSGKGALEMGSRGAVSFFDAGDDEILQSMSSGTCYEKFNFDLEAMVKVREYINSMPRGLDDGTSVQHNHAATSASLLHAWSGSIEKGSASIESFAPLEESKSKNLLSYLSKLPRQAATKSGSADLGIDPPTGLESLSSECYLQKDDPPLCLTLSEEIRSANEPENNPLKDSVSQMNTNQNEIDGSRDPELHKPTMYDIIGEPVTTARVGRLPLDNFFDVGLVNRPTTISAFGANSTYNKNKLKRREKDQLPLENNSAALESTKLDCAAESQRIFPKVDDDACSLRTPVEASTSLHSADRNVLNTVVAEVNPYSVSSYVESSRTPLSIKRGCDTKVGDGGNIVADQIFASVNGCDGPRYSEMVTCTPKRKITLLTLRTTELKSSGSDTDHINTQLKCSDTSIDCDSDCIRDDGDTFHYRIGRDPDGCYPAKSARDLAEAVESLYCHLSGTEDNSDSELYSFSQLARFSFQFIFDDGPTSSGISQILTRATELHISLAVVDRFLHFIFSLNRLTKENKTENGTEQFDDDAKILAFLRNLVRHVEALEKTDLYANDQIQASVGSRSLDEYAFEVEINDGYAKKEYGPSADDESWWEVAARLKGTHIDNFSRNHNSMKIEGSSTSTRKSEDLDNASGKIESTIAMKVAMTDESRERFLHVTSDESNGIASVVSNSAALKTAGFEDVEDGCNVEDDIVKFWQDREEVRRRYDSRLSGRKSENVRNTIRKGTSCSTAEDSKSRVSSSVASSKSVPRVRPLSNMRTTINSINQMRESSTNWASRQKTVDDTASPEPINAVAAASGLLGYDNHTREQSPFSNFWRHSYTERTRHHEGFFDVDVYSLYAASVVKTYRHMLDNVPWESRSVKQRFLYEQSVSFTRNWFGCLSTTKVNKKINEPVCRPKSMEMPMQAGEWTEEWYKRPVVANVAKGNGSSTEDLSDEESWEDTPECGKIRNVRLRPGEQISRVTPDLTSYLRRSRWRRKHFPQELFHTDKRTVC